MSTKTILCRLCALECDKYVDIYDEAEDINMQLATKISSCLQIWVSREDVLPTTVCHMCRVKLGQTFQFYRKCNKAQLLLEKIYNDQKKSIKREDINNDAEFQDNPVRKQAEESNKTRESDIDEEVTIIENYMPESSKPCNELGLVAVDVEAPVNPNMKLSALFESDDGSCNEERDCVTEVEKKSERRKKDPNLNDVPANPRLSQMLQEYPWPCTICEDRVMDSLQDLRDHYRVDHQQPPIFRCVTCGKQYERYRSFSRHIKLHRNPQKFTCEICGKSFAQKTILQSHATVHVNDRPHVCHTCGKSFKNFSSLRVHGRRHLPDQAKEKYGCDVCQKEFSTRHTLETHRKIHTGERDFVCDICGKSFFAKGSLDYHLLSHTGDQNHVCPTCGKAFKTGRLLGKHISLHSGIKPHQCDVCGKQFRERGALREHSRIHTGAMPYSCEFCGKCFRFKGILTVHRRQHTGERPYACLDCRRFFTNWANYNKHMKRIHHYDTSNPANRKRLSETNVSHDSTDTERSKSAIADSNINQYLITPAGISQMHAPSTEPVVDNNSN